MRLAPGGVSEFITASLPCGQFVVTLSRWPQVLHGLHRLKRGFCCTVGHVSSSGVNNTPGYVPGASCLDGAGMHVDTPQYAYLRMAPHSPALPLPMGPQDKFLGESVGS